MGNGKGSVVSPGGVLTQQMIEDAAAKATANFGKPTNILIPYGSAKVTLGGASTMWTSIFYGTSIWENTPYEKFESIHGDLESFARMHLLLFKLKVSQYSPKENYDYISHEAAIRVKKIRPKPTEKTLRRIKRREKRRKEDESLPFYKRGLSWNSRGRV